VKVIFSEASVSPKLAREVASEAGATVDASLYGDTLGPAGSPGATYIGAMTYDVAAMVRGFRER
jgi:ABC-type Zn uptake system ZnuABC Zn-binding protein ZnuA